MKISAKNIKILEKLLHGEVLPASSAKSKLIDTLIDEKILLRKGKHKRTITLPDRTALITFFANQYQIPDLPDYIRSAREQLNRADFVKLTTDSKDSGQRAFKGFLVSSLRPLPAILNGENITIAPPDGSFIFIYDYDSFVIDKDVTVVGVENSQNFRYMRDQEYLFNNKNLLFVARYPQNQNKDLIRWLQSVPNKYLHFGDFDLAGIGIYLHEYKKHLKERAAFFIPDTIEEDLMEKGNRKRYDVQKQSFDTDTIEEKKLVELVKMIHKYKKGLDQEFYIQNH